MTSEERFDDDVVLRRVVAARPEIREEDVSETSERALAIADRVIRAGPSPDAARPPTRRRRSARGRQVVLGLRVAAAAAVAAVACVEVLSAVDHHGSARTRSRTAADVVHVEIAASKQPLAIRIDLARTPLGRQIERGLQAAEQSVGTGGVARNRKVIVQLTANAKACEAAAIAVRQVHARPGQRAAQRYWAIGILLQATGDRQFISALRAVDDGRRAAGNRLLAVASDTFDRDDILTGWAEQELLGYGPGPVPRSALKPGR